MSPSLIAELSERVHTEGFGGVTSPEALLLMELPEERVPELFPLSDHLRRKHKGDFVKLCGIVNAKSGRCPERCDFCAQSAHFETSSPEYPLMKEEELVARAKEARSKGVREFSIVTSGTSLEDEAEVETVARAITRIRAEGMEPCVSVGLASEKTLSRFREAGLVNVHHNLETAKSHHREIVKTHTFEDEVEAVERAKAFGFQTCCGGIMGMGETRAQRVELAETLKEMGVSHVPVNFLSPIAGTPLYEKAKGKPSDLTPMECLKILAVYRLMMPTFDIFCMGGREVNLQGEQHRIFEAGANGMMVGGYLTTSGRNHFTDLHMIRDLGLKVLACSGHGEHEVARSAGPLAVLPS